MREEALIELWPLANSMRAIWCTRWLIKIISPKLPPTTLCDISVVEKDFLLRTIFLCNKNSYIGFIWTYTICLEKQIWLRVCLGRKKCLLFYQGKYSKLDGKDYVENIKILSKSLYYSIAEIVETQCGPSHTWLLTAEWKNWSHASMKGYRHLQHSRDL